jgi:hypothetical protein
MELIELLQKDAPVEGKSVKALLKEMGKKPTLHHKRTLREKLAEAIDAGQVECGWGRELRIDGIPALVPVYRVKHGG